MDSYKVDATNQGLMKLQVKTGTVATNWVNNLRHNLGEWELRLLHMNTPPEGVMETLVRRQLEKCAALTGTLLVEDRICKERGSRAHVRGCIAELLLKAENAQTVADLSTERITRVTCCPRNLDNLQQSPNKKVIARHGYRRVGATTKKHYQLYRR